jgi:hypothetical protein
MPRQSGTSDAILERRAKVARLYCTGWPQHKIAARFNVCRQQITKDLAVIRESWRRAMVGEFDKLKAEQLAKIDAAEVEAWRGWRRSLRAAQKSYAKVVDDAGEVRKESGKTEEGQAGDPRFLEVVLKCVERRCRLVGADDGAGSFVPPITIIRIEVPAQPQRPEPVTVLDAPSDGIRIRTEGSPGERGDG